MPKQNMIAKQQGEALRLEVLRRYFDFSHGRPTAASIAEAMGLSPDTVETWLADPDNAYLLDEIVPLWPNLGGARVCLGAGDRVADGDPGRDARVSAGSKGQGSSGGG